MTTLVNAIWKLKIWKDTRGQDFVEYAMIAAFIASVFGALSPDIANSISTVFSSVGSTLTQASITGN